MPAYICVTCGVQYPESDTPPESCPICEDERQYVNAKGQQWTTLADLQQTHQNNFSDVEANLVRISTEPRVAIGQTPYLISTDEGNILWECNSFIDDATVAEIQARGGLKAIAISHPHFYDAMVEWSQAFGGIPIYIHESNRQWVMRPNDNIHFWEGESFDLGAGLTIIRVGGHFEGSSVLYWANGADNKGALFTGDSIMVASDRKHVSFMYSYPNYIPMSPSKVRYIVSAIEAYDYDRLYSSWVGQVIDTCAKQSVKISAERYIQRITD
ncbi:MAG: MBL fold metallo-hydrolase [Phototrophicaceae bacterium]